jgi:hypothetical protein
VGVEKYALEKPIEAIANSRRPDAIVSSATTGKRMKRRLFVRPAITCPATAGDERITGARKKVVKIMLPTQKIPPSM